jgi:hypothetical protein
MNNTIGIILLIAAIVVSLVVCYRCIRDGKVGPQFGLKFCNDEDPPSDGASGTHAPCKCLLRGYYVSFAILLGSAAAALLIPSDLALATCVLLMLAASIALGLVQQRLERRCPDLAKQLLHPYF